MSHLLVRLVTMRGPLVACSSLVLFLLAGCPQEPPLAPTGPASSAVSATAAPTTTPSAKASTAATASAPPAASTASAELPKVALCGCGLCAPVVSNDACSTDADCAPATPCHADKCVAKANAAPRKPDTACTMNLMCNTIDANTCGCHQGKCALMPRVKP